MRRWVPDESRSYRHLFFAVSALWLLVTVWAIADEAWVRRPWKRWQREYAHLRGEATAPHIEQRVVPALEAVDRCPTCHAGIEDAKMRGEAIPRVLRAHPDLDALERYHPPRRFGCTVCHGGDGLALTRKAAHGRAGASWVEPLREGPMLEGACARCHPADVPLEGAPRLARGARTFVEKGCAGCHSTPGRDKPIRWGPSLRHIASKLRPAALLAWLRKPRARRRLHVMPAMWPDSDPVARSRRDDETLAIAAFLLSASTPFEAPPVAARGDAAAGRALFDRVGCRGCHTTGQDDVRIVAGDEPGGAKQANGEADTWGDFGDDAAAQGGRSPSRTGGAASGGGGSSSPAGQEEDAWDDFGAEPPAPGQPTAEVHRPAIDFGPRLDDVRARLQPGFAAKWLRSPHAYDPAARMPDLRLDAQQAADIAAYIEQLGPPPAPAPPTLRPPLDPALVRRGRDLVAKYGCYGCHDIAGFEREPPPGPDLTDFALKSAELMSFGPLPTPPAEARWREYAERKIRSPRAFRTDTIDPVMPHFDSTDEEVADLLAYLASLRGEAPAPVGYAAHPPERARTLAAGRRLVRERNCTGCHTLEGHAGDILRYYDDPSLGAPPLDGEGARTRPGWLYDFLRHPVRLRPWLALRMPDFGLTREEASALVDYFSALADRPAPYRDVHTPPLDAAQAAQAKHLFEALRCVSCHRVAAGGVVSARDLAPDLGLARQRLDPAWVRRFLADPSGVLPGTRMPAFFPGGTTPVPEVAGGDARAQIDLLVRYLMHLGLQAGSAGAPSPAPVPAPAEPTRKEAP